MQPKPYVILVSISGRGYFEEITQGIADACHEYPNLRILTLSGDRGPERLRMQLDGYIVKASAPETLKRWSNFRGPIVNVSNNLNTPGAPTLCSDDYRAGVLAAEHYIERGLKQVAIIHAHGSRYAILRLAGFQDRIRQETGIQISVSPDTDEEYFPLFEPAPDLDAWIQQLPTPCGLFCTDDFQAKCVADRLFSLGIEIPSQLSVLGVNDDRILCELSPVPISSVRLNGRKVGREALRLVMEALEGTPIPDSLPLIPPEGITLRKSTDLHCTQDPLVSEALQLITNHLHDVVDVPFLCDHLHVSRRVLERRFQEALGHAPYEHILRARLQRAKQLLLDRPGLSIQQIADLCGYRHTNLFYRQFRLQECCSPNEWRSHQIATKHSP